MKTRLSIHFSKAQLEWLREQATERGLSLGEYVRRVVDEAREAKR